MPLLGTTDNRSIMISMSNFQLLRMWYLMFPEGWYIPLLVHVELFYFLRTMSLFVHRVALAKHSYLIKLGGTELSLACSFKHFGCTNLDRAVMPCDG